MRTTCTSIVLSSALLAGLAGCQAGSRARVHPDASTGDSMFQQIAGLVGEWEMDDGAGNKQHAATFAVTAGGSAVREIMFPGGEMEMTNLYHMDGDRLVITHYCAAGNQPRMTASEMVETADGKTFHFEFDSVSNLRESHDHYMGNMTLTIHNGGGVTQEWRSYDRDGNLTEPAVFPLTRKFNW